MKQQEKQEILLNKLYDLIFDDNFKATQSELQIANKTVFLYMVSRLNVLQVCACFTLIIAHKSELIYDDKTLNNAIFETLKSE